MKAETAGLPGSIMQRYSALNVFSKVNLKCKGVEKSELFEISTVVLILKCELGQVLTGVKPKLLVCLKCRDLATRHFLVIPVH